MGVCECAKLRNTFAGLPESTKRFKHERKSGARGGKAIILGYKGGDHSKYKVLFNQKLQSELPQHQHPECNKLCVQATLSQSSLSCWVLHNCLMIFFSSLVKNKLASLLAQSTQLGIVKVSKQNKLKPLGKFTFSPGQDRWCGGREGGSSCREREGSRGNSALVQAVIKQLVK